jgi:hypothetical protein
MVKRGPTSVASPPSSPREIEAFELVQCNCRAIAGVGQTARNEIARIEGFMINIAWDS